MTMTVLDAVAAHLAAEGFGVVGTSIFIAILPDQLGASAIADSCIGLFEYGSGPPTQTMNGEVSALERPRINAICRAAVDDYQACRVQAAAVRRCLGRVSNDTYSGLRLLTCNPLNHPEPLGVDHKQRPMLSVAFEVWHDAEVLS